MTTWSFGDWTNRIDVEATQKGERLSFYNTISYRGSRIIFLTTNGYKSRSLKASIEWMWSWETRGATWSPFNSWLSLTDEVENEKWIAIKQQQKRSLINEPSKVQYNALYRNSSIILVHNHRQFESTVVGSKRGLVVVSELVGFTLR